MNQSNSPITINPQVLVELVSVRMPFGKYKDRILCDLPGPYLLWFYQKGFPAGRLGEVGSKTLKKGLEQRVGTSS